MFKWLQHNKDIGVLILRLFIGSRLIYGVTDNILHWEHMLDFEAFLGLHHFPFPLVSAVVSVAAQAIAGFLILIGYKTRWAALLMVFNFAVAYFMVHLGQPYEQLTAVLSIFFASVLLLFTGAGKYSFDREALQLPVAVLHAEKRKRNIH